MVIRVLFTLAISGIIAIAFWYLNGTMVTPVESAENIDIQLAVKVCDAAPTLEHTVSGLLWLIENGTLTGEILIIDDGMDEYTRLTAEMLAKDCHKVHFITQENYGS